jgi:hypothetical protein
MPHRLETETERRNGTMSDQTARPAQTAQAGAKLESLYKPVGIAALNAAALCLRPVSKKTSGK